jgi:hypothetical protein
MPEAIPRQSAVAFALSCISEGNEKTDKCRDGATSDSNIKEGAHKPSHRLGIFHRGERKERGGRPEE